MLAGGESSYMFGLLVAASLLSIVLVPVVLGSMGLAFGLPLRTPVAAIVKLVGVTVVAPLCAAVFVRSMAPELAARITRPALAAGMIMLAGGALPVVFNAGPAIVSLIGDGTLAAIAAFVLTGLAAGHLLGGPAPEQRAVLAFSTAFRHPAIALAIAQTNFVQQKTVLAAVLLYLVVGVVATIPYVAWRRRHPSPQINSRIVA